MKVCVFDAKDPEMPIGMGNLCRTEDIRIAGDEYGDRVVCILKDHPVIVMEETGDIVYGIECWWMPV